MKFSGGVYSRYRISFDGVNLRVRGVHGKILRPGKVREYSVYCLYAPGKKQRSVFSHQIIHEQFIGPIPEGFVVDHIDDTIDADGFKSNCLSNLQAISQSDNIKKGKGAARIQSRYEGVSRHRDLWHVKFRRGKEQIYIGVYKIEDVAGRASILGRAFSKVNPNLTPAELRKLVAPFCPKK